MQLHWLVMIFFVYPSRAFIHSISKTRSSSSTVRLASYDRNFATSEVANHRKRAVFLGTPQVAAESLQILFDASQSHGLFDIIAVVSQPAVTQKKVTPPSPVHALAVDLKLPVLTPSSARDADFLSHLESLSVDLCITAAYGNYLPKKFLTIPKFGTINIHPSLLPLYRGAAPVQRCLERGDSVTGVSILFTVQKMDAGPIIAQIPYPLTGNEQAPQVLSDCFKLGTHALLKALPTIFDGSVEVLHQAEDQASHAPKMTAEDSIIDFRTMSASTVHNKCRAFVEWPSSVAEFQIGGDKVKMKLIATHVISSSASEERSNIVEVVKYPGGKKPVDMLRVVCGDGSVLGVLEVTPINRRKMGIKDLMNGIKGDKAMQWIA